MSFPPSAASAATTPARAATPKSAFGALPLSPATLENLQQLGYHAMTPIQAACLPAALSGRDVIAQAPTGSGKTAVFALTLGLHLKKAPDLTVGSLVLCPTRELADQVSTEIRRIVRGADNVKVVTLCGGVALRGQAASLAHGAHIVVGTPGRVLDHLEREHLDLAALHTLVLDEADRMLDMGFLDDITKLLRQCPTQRQTLLFSATYPPGIETLSRQFMREPLRIDVPSETTKSLIQQRWYEVTPANRLDTVGLLLRHFRPVSTLVFCNTKLQCRALVKLLQQQGVVALALYGELEQRERDQVLVQFANQSCSVLVATDLAARGLDVARLEAVINVDVTPSPEVHIHRIGRTGRAGCDGLALNLASLDEMGSVGRIEQLQGQASVWHPLSELTPASTQALVPPMATLQMVGGRKEKIRAGDVLGALTGEAGLQREQVGKIDVNEFSTYIAVQRALAPLVAQKLQDGRVKGKRVKVRLLPDFEAH